jgi:hypothetical protein
MTLRLVHSREVACWPWHLADLTGEPTFGATCQDCGRDVAQPRLAAGERPVCCYCAMDKGLIPAEDRPVAFGRPAPDMPQERTK